MEPCDDHVWITVHGKNWAIRAISRPVFYLWRGYAPDLEFAVLDTSKIDWKAYCDAAVKLLEERRTGCCDHEL